LSERVAQLDASKRRDQQGPSYAAHGTANM
jgi:hypothetical protein